MNSTLFPVQVNSFMYCTIAPNGVCIRFILLSIQEGIAVNIPSRNIEY